jgi:nucleotide-binding universal stress UspA family protein
MFRKIMVAFDESPQANHDTGVHLITVSEPLPLYTAIIDAQVPGGRQMLLDERKTYYRELQKGAIAQASGAGLDVQGIVIEGEEAQTIVDRILDYNPDLLILGRRHHSTISGLWNRTVHNIAQKVRCNILAVY